MSNDQRARLVLDAPVTEAALGLLTPALAKEVAEEVRAVFQNVLVAKGIASRYDSEKSVASIHMHDESPCGGCRNHTLDGLTNY